MKRESERDRQTDRDNEMSRPYLDCKLNSFYSVHEDRKELML